MYKVSIVGGSGYTGGELVRILLQHPQVQVQQVTSRSKLGEFIYQTHPNLRKRTQLKYTDPENIEPCDVLFLALPHGESQKRINQFDSLAEYIIDLSADFRLKSPELYQLWYKQPHHTPEWLPKFVYGLPELHRKEICTANYVSGVGCNATAANLALLPLRLAGYLDNQMITIEAKVGSSEGGASGNPGSHHPERSGIARTYSAYGHRHTAEIIQEMHMAKVTLTLTSVDMVRGVLATAHLILPDGITNKDLWHVYREVSKINPFIRIVKEKRGIYRVPEPKILAGSNYADLGFEYNEDEHHLISICAIDNLMKGASGSAVQAMNLMLGLDETTGLAFPGLHPI
jgi:LysW-gamma-L-alpha-aminoadipyl-6-phosphate/LysW-L-glutamyl-5-phosphate reductase